MSRGVWVMGGRRILDNRDGRVLQTVFEEYSNDTKELKIAVGYFYVSGFDLVKDHLMNIPKIFLVIGTETDVSTEREITLGHIEKEIQDDINSIADPKKIAALDELHQYIKSGKIELRVYTKSRFHAKAYIFKRVSKDSDVAIIGSSNFTRQGLGSESGSNTELNSRHTEQGTVDELVDWFANIWDESKPYQKGMLRLIENSPAFVGIRKNDPCLVSPAELFKVILMEHVGQIRPLLENTLTSFQQVGVHNAHQKIRRYNGCMICDSVGLGKTFIGLELIRDAQRKGNAVLLIVPAHISSNWKSEIERNFSDISLEDERLKIMSMAELARYDLRTDQEELSRLRDQYSFVVIDEAHRLRTPGTFNDVEEVYVGSKTYANLKFLQKPPTKFVLLTATPINNSANDAKNQLEIFTSPNAVKNYDTSIDVNCFDDYKRCNDMIKKLQHAERETGEDKTYEINEEQSRQQNSMIHIKKILEEIMILRTRTTVLKEYSDIQIGGKKIMTEIPKINVEKYVVSEGHIDLYDDVSRVISDLRLPHITMINPGSQGQNMSGLYRIHLFKRLESSIYALSQSLDNLKDREKTFMLDIGTLGLERAILKLQGNRDGVHLDEFDYTEQDDALSTPFVKLDLCENDIVDALKYDLDMLDSLISRRIKPLRKSKYTFADPKIDRLKSLLIGQPDKVIIFSQYADTVSYLYNHIKTMTFADTRLVDCVVGDVQKNLGSDLDTSEKIGRFAPRANHWNVDPADEINILITTDKLAEGVNLQDSSRIINYDLPWNPMRIVQRIGRVDRIGSKSRTIVHNMLPDAGLDRFLGLLERLSLKIHNIADIIGKETQILSDDEVINPRSIGIKINKLQKATLYETYSTESNGKLLSDFKTGKYGKESADLYNVATKHGMSIFASREPGAYSILKTDMKPRVFVMFRVFDAKSGRKLDNLILTREISGNKITTMSINDPLILEMPDMQTGQHTVDLKQDLDATTDNITSYFEEHFLNQIKDNYYKSMMNQVTDPVSRVQKILIHKLEQTTQNYQIDNTLTPDLTELGRQIYNFLIENELTREDAKYIRTVFQTQRNWDVELMATPIDKLIYKVSKIHRRRWKDRPEYTKSFTKDNITSIVVCKGVWT